MSENRRGIFYSHSHTACGTPATAKRQS